MSKFKIIQDSPYQFKDKILEFWQEYLPGTPAGRLDWMENNPAGSAIWLFAIEEKTGRLAGTISLFPKDLFLDGKKINAAIIGDFMLHRSFRVFGPALALLKAAIAYQELGVFDFLYTIPNLKSKKLAEKVGFRPAGELCSMMNPQRFDFLIRKYSTSFLSKILDKSLLLAVKLFSRATYTGCSGSCEEIDWNDKTFDTFCQKINKTSIGLLTGDKCLAYLDWRYRQNPELESQVFIFRKRESGNIQGFFVFSLNNNRLGLIDIQASDNKIILEMIKKIITISKKSKTRGIYCSVYANNPLLLLIKRCCFFDTKEQIAIYTYPEKIKEIEQWAFTSADRNI